MAVYTKIETKTATITIATSTTISDVVDLGASAICGIEVPSSFTSSTLSIYGASTGGGTFGLLTYLDGFPATSSTLAAGARVSVDPILTAGWPYIKIVAGTAQAANRAITLLVRPVS